VSWPEAVAASVSIICVAAVVIYFLHLLAQPAAPRDRAKPPEWTSERTTKYPQQKAPER
jgi:hypothetical protein